MKTLFPYFGIALLIFLAGPAAADTSSSMPAKANPAVPGTLQVTVVKRDAHENVIAVKKLGLAQVIALASQLVPGAISKNASEIKSLTISYN